MSGASQEINQNDSVTGRQGGWQDGLCRSLPWLIPLFLLGLYGLFDAGWAGKYSFTGQVVAVGLGAVAWLCLGRFLPLPRQRRDWLICIMLVLVWRFPPVNALLFLAGWAAAWQLLYSPRWVRQCLAGIGWFCCAGVVAGLWLGSEWPLGNRNWMAMLVGILWSVHVGRWLGSDEKRPGWPLLGFSGLMVFLIFFEQRGQAALVVIAVVLLVLMVRATARPGRFSLLLVVVLLGIGAWVLFSGIADRAMQSLKGASYFSRLDIWQLAWIGFLDAPVFGKGHWGIPRSYGLSDPIRYVVLSYTDREAVNAHNLFLQLLVTSGLVGTTALVASIAYFAVRAFRTCSRKALPLLFGLAAFLVIGCVSKGPFSVPGLCMWGGVFGALACLGSTGHAGCSPDAVRGVGRLPETVGRGLLVALFLIFCVIQPLHHEYLLKRPQRVLDLPFWWVFPSDRILHLGALEMSARLYASGDHAALYRFESLLNAHVPRKSGMLRLGYAARAAGRPTEELRQAAITQFLWNPLELRPQNNEVLRNLMLSGGVGPLENDLRQRKPAQARALRAFAQPQDIKEETVRELLANNSRLPGMDLAVLLHYVLQEGGREQDLRLRILERLQRDLGRHWQWQELQDALVGDWR